MIALVLRRRGRRHAGAKAIEWKAALVAVHELCNLAISAWADRITGDPAVNRSIRNRMMHPIEVPVGAVLGIGIFVLAISRILLAVPKGGAYLFFGLVPAIIFGVGILIVLRPTLSRSVIAVVVDTSVAFFERSWGAVAVSSAVFLLTIRPTARISSANAALRKRFLWVDKYDMHNSILKSRRQNCHFSLHMMHSS